MRLLNRTVGRGNGLLLTCINRNSPPVSAITAGFHGKYPTFSPVCTACKSTRSDIDREPLKTLAIPTTMHRRPNTPHGHFPEFVVADPLSQYLAEIRWDAQASTGCMQTLLFNDPNSMTCLL